MMDSGNIARFRKTLRVFERELDKQNSAGCCCGISVSQCHVLMELIQEDNISLNQLSSKLDVDKSSASRTVESLVNKNMVARKIPKNNRRVTNLSLTKTGTDVCIQINRDNNAYYADALGSLPEEDLEIFLRTFEQLTSRMSQLNQHPTSTKLTDYETK